VTGLVESPLQWKEPQPIFVKAMSDLIHEELPLVGDIPDDGRHDDELAQATTCAGRFCARKRLCIVACLSA
jgi:hypothetical protein